MKRPTHAIAVAVMATSLLACNDLEVELVQLTEPPLPGRVTETSIEVTEGTAIGVRIVVIEDGSIMVDPGEIEWQLEGTAATFQSVYNSPGYYIIGGAKVGQSSVIAKDGSREVAIPVIVQPQ